jgi:hypothetical protein
LGKEAAVDQVDHRFELGVAVVVVPRVVAAGFEGHDFCGDQAKEKEVFVAHLLANFDIGPVEGADGEGTIHRKFHVAGAGGFFTGGRNLL